ncbi:NCS2 family permease [Bacillus kwashiorkori]|uniref:NCS2 family permease n=1 Tax=Bacillus kwashiorkori TaxID=1522318 RepID=UPI00193A9B63|nr:NCS2 family permease [Bacillus kwashiorkori]
MKSWLEKQFKLSNFGTNPRIEMTAGFTTFITMAYIIIVHPNLMKAAGMPVGAVMTSTIIVSALFSIIMGLYTNRPFALAPGLGGNAFFAYTIVASGLASWQTGLGMVFIGGVIFVLLTVLGIREAIAKFIPKNIKLAIGSAVGLFIVGIGLTQAEIIVINSSSGNLTLGNMHSKTVVLALIGLIVTFGLMARKIRGAVLYGILLTTIIGIPLGVTKLPTDWFTLPPSPGPILFEVDWLQALQLSFIPLIFTFFAGDFFSTMGTLLGVGAKAKLLDENGDLPGIKKPFLVDGVGTIAGAFAGLTTVTTYIESASGVEVGGRTGLTAIWTGFFFLLSLLFMPILLMIPTVATAPALIAIGLGMLTTLQELDYEKTDEIIPAFVTIIFTGLSFSIANGIVFGILTYAVMKVLSGKLKEVPVSLIIFCIPLVYYLWLN